VKSRLFFTCAASIGLSIFAGLPAWAATQVTLSSAAPAAAEPGLTTVRLLGSGFPTGMTVNPANIQIQLAPQGGGSATQVTATQYQAIVGTTARVAFLVPASLSPTTPTVFTASLSDTTDGFSSSNSATFTIDPLASISLVSPNSAQQGQTVSVTITGSYSGFLSGLSQVTASGAGISAGIPSVASTTSLTVQFVIAANAALGARAITVTTGSEVATLAAAFTVKQATVAVPNVVGQTQAAATTTLTGAGLAIGTVTTASSSTVASVA
jgi:hypothetical protein